MQLMRHLPTWPKLPDLISYPRSFAMYFRDDERIIVCLIRLFSRFIASDTCFLKLTRCFVIHADDGDAVMKQRGAVPVSIYTKTTNSFPIQSGTRYYLFTIVSFIFADGYHQRYGANCRWAYDFINRRRCRRSITDRNDRADASQATHLAKSAWHLLGLGGRRSSR
mgnify:CR=1 FL=1